VIATGNSIVNFCSATSISNISQTVTHFEKMRDFFVIWYVMKKKTPPCFKNTFSFFHNPSFKLVTQNWQKCPSEITLHNLVSVKISVENSGRAILVCLCAFDSAIMTSQHHPYNVDIFGSIRHENGFGNNLWNS
jgi:hypothetical protein